MKYAKQYGRNAILESDMKYRRGWVRLIYTDHALQRVQERMKGDKELYPRMLNISHLNINRGYSYDGKYMHKVVVRQEFNADEWIFLVVLPGKGLVKSVWFEQKSMTKKEQTEKQWALFQEMWKSLTSKKCWSCDKKIYGPNKPLYWDHLLEKSKYPELRYERKNLFFCCPDCHAKKEAGFPTAKHKQAIDMAANEFLN